MSLFDRLPPATATLYAELVSELVALRAQHRGELPSGTLAEKKIRGRSYWYVQYVEAGKRRQVYLGADSDEMRNRIEALRERWDSLASDRRRIALVVSQLAAGGVHSPDGTSGRVLEVLSNQGVFDAGAVLVGSLAFLAYGGMLGVRWGSGFRTADIDLATDRRVKLAVPTRLLDALEATGLPFDSIPALNPRSPSTSFRVRNQQLTVDILTPEVGPPAKGPVRIPSLGVHAMPLRFLDYLIDDPEPSAIVTRTGVLAQVPHPARFAFHKLIVSGRRPAAMATRSTKDIAQAEQILSVLLEDRPGDLLAPWGALAQRGPGWLKAVRVGAARLNPTIRDELAVWVPDLF